MIDPLARITFYGKWLALHAVILLLFPVTQGLNSEKVSPRIILTDKGGRYVTISCQAMRKDLSILFFCPFLPGAYCFQNCRPVCTRASAECRSADLLHTMATNCSQEVADHVTTSYLVDTYDSRNTGEWYCSHEGMASARVSVENRTAPTTSTTLSTKYSSVTSQTSTIAPQRNTTLAKPIPKPTDKSNKKDMNGGMDKKTNSTNCHKSSSSLAPQVVTHPLGRMEYILALMFLLLLSLMINMAFCTRCLLVRCYLDRQAKLKLHQGSNACLDCCLCLKAKQKSHSNPNAQPVDGNNFSALLNPLDRGYFVDNQMLMQEVYSPSPVNLPHPGVQYQQMPVNYLVTERMRTGPGAPMAHRNSMPAALVRSRTFPVPPGFPQPTLPGILYATPNGSTTLTPVALVAAPNSRNFLPQTPQQLSPSSEVPAAALRTSQLLYDEVPQTGSEPLEAATSGSNPLPMRASTSLSSLPPRPRGGSIQLMHPTLSGRTIGSSLHSSSPQQRPLDMETDAYSYRSEATGSENASSHATNAADSSARLEMSRHLLRKADTLLREAGSLLTENNRSPCNA